jgi:hypothetical protein
MDPKRTCLNFSYSHQLYEEYKVYIKQNAGFLLKQNPHVLVIILCNVAFHRKFFSRIFRQKELKPEKSGKSAGYYREGGKIYLKRGIF